MVKPERPSEMKQMAGRRLAAARLALGIERQDVMAHVLGVAPTTYNNWENGLRLADPAAMARLLHRTGIGPDWVYAGALRSIPFDLASAVEQHARALDAALHTTLSELAAAAPEAPHSAEKPAAARRRGRGQPALTDKGRPLASRK